jgi:serine protease
LYAGHDDYVDKVRTAAATSVSQGFLLPEDAQAVVAEAEASDVLAAPRADGSVRVVEFFHPAQRRYFWTADVADRNFLDFAGGAGGGWFRTGESFFAWPAQAAAPADAVPVCRFEGRPGAGPASHFYTANVAECEALKNSAAWRYEGVAFLARMQCTAREEPVTRLWSAGSSVAESRHRFVARAQEMADTIAGGFVREGQAFCAGR